MSSIIDSEQVTFASSELFLCSRTVGLNYVGRTLSFVWRNTLALEIVNIYMNSETTSHAFPQIYKYSPSALCARPTSVCSCVRCHAHTSLPLFLNIPKLHGFVHVHTNSTNKLQVYRENGCYSMGQSIGISTVHDLKPISYYRELI